MVVYLGPDSNDSFYLKRGDDELFPHLIIIFPKFCNRIHRQTPEFEFRFRRASTARISAPTYGVSERRVTVSCANVFLQSYLTVATASKIS